MNRRFGYTIGFFALLVMLPSFCLAADDKDLRESVRSVVDSVVSAGKDVVTGVSQGVESALDQAEGARNAQAVSYKQSLAKLLEISALGSEQLGDRSFKVTLAINNQHEYPVRITRLWDVTSVVLLDSEGYSYVLANPKEQGKDVIVLGKSRTRVRFTFDGVEGRPALLRLFDTDIVLPPALSNL
mgnify:FL=1